MERINGLYWMQHCGCWFGFTERAHFVKSPSGGYFAREHTTEQIFSVAQNGLKKPKESECPYCKSDNQAIRETFFNQCCSGCVIRMGVPS